MCLANNVAKRPTYRFSNIADDRRRLSELAMQVREWIDTPQEWLMKKLHISDHIQQETPSLGAVITLPAIMLGDNTQDPLKRGTAADYNYKKIGFNQRHQAAEEGHYRTVTQEGIEADIDAEIQAMQDDLRKVLQNSELTKYLMPNYEQKMRAVYKTYTDALENAKTPIKAEPDTDKALKKAEKIKKEAYDTFCEQSKKVITEAIHAFLIKAKEEKLATEIANFDKLNIKGDGGESSITAAPRIYFTKQDKKKLKDIIDQHYKAKEPYLISFYTAHLDPSKKSEEITSTQAADQEELDRLEQDLNNKLDLLFSSCLAAKTKQTIATQVDVVISGDKYTSGSLANFLATELWPGLTYEMLLMYVENGPAELKRAYSAYNQVLIDAQKMIEKNVRNATEAQRRVEAARASLDGTRIMLMEYAIGYFADSQMKADLEEEMDLMNANAFATQADKDEMVKLIETHWGEAENEEIHDGDKGEYRTYLLMLYYAREEGDGTQERMLGTALDELNELYERDKKEIRERANRQIEQRMQQRQAY